VSVITKVVGLDLLQKRLLRIEQELRARERINQQATVVIDRWVQQNFEAEGRPAMGGAGWRPLAGRTIARRRKGDGRGGYKILQDTGRLKGDWKHDWTANLAKVQSGVDYADEHHVGKGALPVRRILPSDRQIWPALQKIYEGWIRGIFVR
jgi:phage virion morphogenesis protein